MEKPDLFLVTDWEKVEKDDFYLGLEWEEEFPFEVKAARRLQRRGMLYIAYCLFASDLCPLSQTDAAQVFIDRAFTVILCCESKVVGNEFKQIRKFEG